MAVSLAGLPEDVVLGQRISSTPRAELFEARRGNERLAVRIGSGALAEAGVLARVDSPGLPALVEAGRLDDGRPFLVRAWVEGRCFDDEIGAVDVGAVVDRLVGLFGTLASLHEAGIVHRDLKSDNVRVRPDGTAVLVDLDLALTGEGTTTRGAGTPTYLAPEVLLGHPATPASDLFSAGAMLAFAFAGRPDAHFNERFPREDFWASSGLDAESLPDELSPLIRALVRRRPGDRPSSARGALRMLPAQEGEQPPDLGLPRLLGRRAVVDDLRVRLRRSRGVLLLLTEDPAETDQLLEHIQVLEAIDGRRVELIPLASPRGVMGVVQETLRVLRADAVEAESSDLTERLAQRIVEEVVAERPEGYALLVTVGRDIARAVGRALRDRLLESESARVGRFSWPPLSRASLEKHLGRVTGDASPGMVERLASQLIDLSGGRATEVNACLEQAEELAVVRREGGSWALLLDRWPQAGTGGKEARLLAQLPDGARRLLAALTVLEEPASLTQAAAVAALEETDALEALAALTASRMVADPAAGQRLETEPRWKSAARVELDAEVAKELHRRALVELERDGMAPGRRAWHRLHGDGGDASRLEALKVAHALRQHGDVGGARRLLDLVSARPDEVSEEVTVAARILACRLDIAQGDADRAWQSLRADVDDAPAELQAVALLAAEQSGHRDEALRLAERLESDQVAPGPRAWARLARAYSLLLDGEDDAALLLLKDEPGESTPPEVAVGMLNVKGVIGTRRGEHDEAERLFDRASALAQADGDLAALGRTELNRAHLDRRRRRPSVAVSALHGAADLFTRAGHVPGRALALNNLGVLQRDLGDLHQARELLEESLVLRRRVGDVLGAASSLGSLANVLLDAGQPGAALHRLSRAEALLRHGRYAVEHGLVLLVRIAALALAGRHVEALGQLGHEEVAESRARQPALAARVEALCHHAAGQFDLAKRGAIETRGLAESAGDIAETFRAVSLQVALDAEDAQAATELRQLAEELASPIRTAEADWRTRRTDVALPLAQLAAWLETFDRAGRRDLVRAVALVLADTCEAEGDVVGRRAAHARAAEAADALVEGLPHAGHPRFLDRLTALAGGASTPRRGGDRLDADWLISCNRRMASADDLEGLLRSLVDMALEITRARRGFLVLLEGDAIGVEVAAGDGAGAMAEEERHFSRTVIRRSIEEGSPVVMTDASRDERFAGVHSIDAFELRSVMCVPFAEEGGVRGALYVDDDTRAEAFDEADIRGLRVLGDQAALTIGDLRRRAEIEELNRRLSRKVESQASELAETRRILRRKGTVAPVGGLVGESEVMGSVYMLIERLGPTELPVLVTGPSGTGKDLVARALHERSLRAEGPLVIENVAALPASLLESELFGHARGAFTGADRDRPGLFAEAHGGTFVLDEIGEMPAELQAKLLRVLESGEYRPVGARRTQRADVRIVACTNRDLLARVREGEFREDLYYRLNAAEIRLPPLSDRMQDIPLLVRHFLDRLNEKHGTDKAITDEVLLALVGRAWPGEVRELANEVARLYFLSGDVIDALEIMRPAAGSGEPDVMPDSFKLEDVERRALERALKASGGRKDKAAKLLGISRAGLYAKLKRLGVETGAKTDDGDD